MPPLGNMGGAPKRARANSDDDEERPPRPPRPRLPSPPRQLSNEQKVRIKEMAADLATKFVKSPPKLVETPIGKKKNVQKGAPASFTAGKKHYIEPLQPPSLHMTKTKQQLQAPVTEHLITGLQIAAKEAESLNELIDDARKDGPTINVYRKRLEPSLVEVAHIISKMSKFEGKRSILLLLPTTTMCEHFLKSLKKTEGYQQNKIRLNMKSELGVSLTLLTYEEAKRMNFSERYNLVVLWKFEQCDLFPTMEPVSLSDKYALIE